MKYTQVSQAQTLGPPSSAPKVRRLNTKTAIQAIDVAKKTSNEKLRSPALSIFNGLLYAMKLYNVLMSQGMPIPI